MTKQVPRFKVHISTDPEGIGIQVQNMSVNNKNKSSGIKLNMSGQLGDNEHESSTQRPASGDCRQHGPRRLPISPCEGKTTEYVQKVVKAFVSPAHVDMSSCQTEL